jgi:hypothetical protein
LANKWRFARFLPNFRHFCAILRQNCVKKCQKLARMCQILKNKKTQIWRMRHICAMFHFPFSRNTPNFPLFFAFRPPFFASRP